MGVHRRRVLKLISNGGSMAEQTTATTEPKASRYASRKFLLSAAMVGITTWMRFRNLLTEDAAVSLYMAILGGYQLANVAAKFADTKKTTP